MSVPGASTGALPAARSAAPDADATPAPVETLRRRLLAWLPPAAVCLAAVAGGWLTAGPPARPADAVAPVEWKLPQWRSPEVEAAARRIAEHSLWEPTEALASAPMPGPTATLTPPDWRIVAAVVSSEDRIVLLAVGGERPQELRVGDRLPGGAIIRAIEPDRLQIELNGKRRILRLAPQ